MPKDTAAFPEQYADPFRERSTPLSRDRLHLLGGRFRFESNSKQLLELVDHAYAGVPRHRFSAAAPRLQVSLVLGSGKAARKRGEPPALEMLSGAGFVAGAMAGSNYVVMSPAQGAALVGIDPQMLRFPYHLRYELIEFAVFTLAARVQGLVPLHAACIGRGDRAVLLMGASGAGKSTVALQSLLAGFDFVSEDSTFVAPETMFATGVANFIHVRADSLRWVDKARESAAIRNSPVIRRRSGVQKFEVDLRSRRYRLAPTPLKLAAFVFLSAQTAPQGSLLRPLVRSDLLARLKSSQAYAANQPQWRTFCRNAVRIGGYELRRGAHPRDSLDALRSILDAASPAISNRSSMAPGRRRDT
jgi:hypothetical protein